MKGLIIKDLIALKNRAKIFFILAAFYIVYSIFMKDTNILGAMIIMFCTMIPITTMSYDEYYKWDKYAVSLPVSRKTIVFSKYIFGILFNLAGVVIVAVVYIFTANITVASAIGESLLTLLGLCMISILFLSITLPIMFKFGVEKGRLLMMAVFFTPTILIMLISKLNIAKPSEQALQKLVLISPVIILVILLISIFVSIRIFERKEL